MQNPKDNAPDNSALWQTAFTSKHLTSVETYYSGIERDALGILHGLEKFHHYYFVYKVNVTTDHKSLVAIFKKDMVTLSKGSKESWHISINST